MVTAELAVGLPAVLLVLALVLGALGLIGQQLRCSDAAQAGARAAARGESVATAVSLAQARAPDGAQVQVVRDGDRVECLVTGPDAGPFAGLRASGRAVVLAEPAEDAP